MIEGGQITEIGTHEELMQHSGTYQRLYNMQFSGEDSAPVGGRSSVGGESGGDCVSEVYSMTGYASVRGSVRELVAFTLSMKSVNHRFLDLNLRLPSYCDGLEMQMRRVLKERLRRGHVEVTLQLERRASAEIQLNAWFVERLYAGVPGGG